MAPIPKVIVVTGATGTQGSGVLQVRSLLIDIYTSACTLTYGARNIPKIVAGASDLVIVYAPQALQQDDTFRVRALTRNASSAAAKAIADRGIEVVTADLSNKDTLSKVGDMHDLTTALNPDP